MDVSVCVRVCVCERERERERERGRERERERTDNLISRHVYCTSPYTSHASICQEKTKKSSMIELLMLHCAHTCNVCLHCVLSGIKVCHLR